MQVANWQRLYILSQWAAAGPGEDVLDALGGKFGLDMRPQMAEVKRLRVEALAGR